MRVAGGYEKVCSVSYTTSITPEDNSDRRLVFAYFYLIEVISRNSGSCCRVLDKLKDCSFAHLMVAIARTVIINPATSCVCMPHTRTYVRASTAKEYTAHRT